MRANRAERSPVTVCSLSRTQSLVTSTSWTNTLTFNIKLDFSYKSPREVGVWCGTTGWGWQCISSGISYSCSELATCKHICLICRRLIMYYAITFSSWSYDTTCRLNFPFLFFFFCHLKITRRINSGRNLFCILKLTCSCDASELQTAVVTEPRQLICVTVKWHCDSKVWCHNDRQSVQPLGCKNEYGRCPTQHNEGKMLHVNERGQLLWFRNSQKTVLSKGLAIGVGRRSKWA